MNILFVIYQLDFADHISLSYLSAIAKARGHSTFLCVASENNLVESIKGINPDIVAYSTNILGFNELLSAHKEAKRSRSFTSIMGGPHVTIFPDIFPMTNVDAFCIGEGELAFQDFLICLEQNVSFDNVPNLITKNSSNPVRPLISNIDDLPFPDRDLILKNSFLKNTPKKTFYTTRGCPYNCHYCCNNYYRKLYQGKGKYVRRFSVERVIREIEHVKSRYRTDFIKFGDDLFAQKADSWLEEFSNVYPKRVGIPFNCYLRFDTINEKLLSLLKKAGCYSVHLSVDSTSEKVREEILNRKMKKVDIVQQIKMIHTFGINTWVNYMLSAPESTLNDDLLSISMNKKSKVTYANYSTTVPMKGTALYDYCVEHNMIDPEIHQSDMTGCSQPSTLKCFSEKERNIRYNVYLLGAIIAKFPFPFDKLAIWIIKIIPPNRWFAKLRYIFYQYSIENRIFKLHTR